MTSTVAATSVDDEPTQAAGRADRVAGRLLFRGGVLLATWVLLGAVAVVPLSLLHVWRPVVALPVLLVALALAVRVAGVVPAPPLAKRAALAVVAVAVCVGAWAGLTSAEHVVLRRDAGSYALYGQHLATAGTTVVDVRVPDLGGAAVLADPDVTVGSPAFYEQGRGAGTHVVPQFLPATPAWLSVGWWAGGWTGLLLVPAVALAAALLAFGGLAARLVGPGWAAVATAVLGLSQPVVHAGRSTYSEPLALLVGCAGLAVLVDATRAGAVGWGSGGSVEVAPDRARERSATRPVDRSRNRAVGRWSAAHRLGLLAGLLAGGVALVRVDGLRETALLVPVAGLLALRRNGAGAGLAVGLGVSTLVAAVSALLVSRPYLGSIAGSLVPLAAGAVLLGVLSVLGVRLARRRAGRPRGASGRVPSPLSGALPRLLPAVLAGAVVAVGVVLASRPLWQVVRQDPNDPGSRVVAALQLRQGLTVDGGRTYAEHSVAWLAWWLGVLALVLALAAAAWLAARAASTWRDDAAPPGWLGPLVVALGSAALTLYRPGITPDHPWADRRLVPVVLPATVLLACAAVAGLTRAVRARRGGLAARVVAGCGAAVLLVPPALATLPVATERTERGEVAAVHQACAALGPADTAVLVGSRAANEWPQVLRGVCGVPTVVLRPARSRPVPREALRRVVAAVQAAGRTPVLMTADGEQVLVDAGVSPRQVVGLSTTEDARLLTRRPAAGVPLTVDLWLARVLSSAR
ncbi:MAG TPA: hypothetical protein VKB14_08625 [Actinomycetales bacterium]|nr:hypothetical protein [Actinomycetales bacterium]